MKLLSRIFAVAGVVLLGAPLVSSALSLGRSRSAALLGQPLDMVVSAALDGTEATPAASCFEADVLYGDSKLGSQNVGISVQRAVGNELAVRVRTLVAVDEPVVTVFLRSLCGQNSARKYVLLADAPTEVVGNMGTNGPTNVQTSPSLATVPTGGAAPASSNANVGNAEPGVSQQTMNAGVGRSSNAVAAAPRAVRKRVAPAAEPASKEPQRVADIKVRKPRLTLDPLEGFVLRDPSLKPSAELLTQPTTDENTRAQAAALWRAINAQPQDVLRDAQRLQTIETQVRSLADQSKKQTQEFSGIKAELAQARNERYANPLVYALGLLAAAMTALAGMMWFKQRDSAAQSSTPWYGKMGARSRVEAGGHKDVIVDPILPKPVSKNSGEDDEMDDSLYAVLNEPLYEQNKTSFDASRTTSLGKQNLASATAVEKQEPLPEVRASQYGTEGMAASGSNRSVNAEELFDVQQEADFFVSIGQHSQAIDVLKNHISDNVETSAVAYLDLLAIYHQTDNRDDYEQLREEFNRVFNAQVPPFDSYGSTNRSLADYPSAMSRIESLWPTRKVLEVIEESIFRKSDGHDESFDLPAYRELMLLYAVAKEIIDRDHPLMDFDLSETDAVPLITREGAGESPRVTGFGVTTVQPLPARPVPGYGDMSELDDYLAARSISPSVGVDIDLQDLHQDPPTAHLQTQAAAKSKTTRQSTMDFNPLDEYLPPSSSRIKKTGDR